MKKKWISLIAAGLLTTGALCGCTGTAGETSGSAPKEDTSSIVSSEAETSHTTTSEADSSEKPTTEASSSPKESSGPSDEERKEAKRKTELEELQILAQYKKELAASENYTYSGQFTDISRNEDNTITTTEMTTEHTLTYLDAVIRDVNEDGHYEMIVKYKDESRGSVFVFDVVTVADGKAVPSKYYLYGESFLTGAGTK